MLLNVNYIHSPFNKIINMFILLFLVGGMNKSHRLSHGAKKVTPPSIPSFNPRGSGSSFGSDYSYEKDDSAFSRDPSGGTTSIPVHRSNFAKVSKIGDNFPTDRIF